MSPYVTLGGFLRGAPTLQGPILNTFLIPRGKSNFINEFNEFNKSYQCNAKRHHNYFLPNLLLALWEALTMLGPNQASFLTPRASCMALY